ncbi:MULTISPECIES: hypothetical protein [unclassified Kitasatospora]|uniref:hypothetical protein n=1 Tax=unclassified Kitasatospora TaxID=2633591 RepID=UPI0033CD1504
MTDTPVRVGPSRTDDILLSAVLLPVLAVIPLVAFWLTLWLGFAATDAADVIVPVGLLIGVAASLGVPLSVAFRTRRAGYAVLPAAAVVAPFLVPGWAMAGYPGL